MAEGCFSPGFVKAIRACEFVDEDFVHMLSGGLLRSFVNAFSWTKCVDDACLEVADKVAACLPKARRDRAREAVNTWLLARVRKHNAEPYPSVDS